MIYIFFFNLGYGAMIWITVAEILPLHVRSVATSLAVSFTCVCSFLTSHTYNDLKGKTKIFWSIYFSSISGSDIWDVGSGILDLDLCICDLELELELGSGSRSGIWIWDLDLDHHSRNPILACLLIWIWIWFWITLVEILPLHVQFMGIWI